MSVLPHYHFREELLQVHRPGRRDPALRPEAGQVLVEEDWEILACEGEGPALLSAARDAQDFLAVSMGLFLPLRLLPRGRMPKTSPNRAITFTVCPEDESLPPPGGYWVQAAGSHIAISSRDGRGAARGWYWLESQLDIAGLPAIGQGAYRRAPFFAPRMAHSGYGLDMFPDGYLARLAHLGIDTLLVFTQSANHTPLGPLDFNELIGRAARYGMDVYAYSYIRSGMHPDDPCAAAYYEGTYGAVFKKSPGLRGLVLVGESVEFPSRDPHTTGRMSGQPNPDGLPDSKPSPGWWPCEDYPQWLTMVRDTVRRYSPQADIVFWTYNWGYAPEEQRLALIRSLPKDITLLATFEMFETVSREGHTFNCVDYTLAFEGPGKYFASEAAEAKRQGLRLYAMANTGGLTWDVGVIPYEPAPWLWMKRLEAVREAQREWGLCGIMECHHYGLWPSVISELAQAAYTDPGCSLQEVFERLIRRDFTAAQLEKALSAWRCFDEAFALYPCTNEDQYGPFRVGPSYPLYLQGGPALPAEEAALWGSRICDVRYHPHDCGRAPLANFRYPVEIGRLSRMAEKFAEGARLFSEIAGRLTGWRRENAERLANMGLFLKNCCVSARHAKQWYLLKTRLAAAKTAGEIEGILPQMEQVAQAEIANAQDTIPLVEKDSRLGWEPSMEYVTDRAHLEWKIKATQHSQNGLQMYRDSLRFPEG